MSKQGQLRVNDEDNGQLPFRSSARHDSGTCSLIVPQPDDHIHCRAGNRRLHTEEQPSPSGKSDEGRQDRCRVLSQVALRGSKATKLRNRPSLEVLLQHGRPVALSQARESQPVHLYAQRPASSDLEHLSTRDKALLFRAASAQSEDVAVPGIESDPAPESKPVDTKRTSSQQQCSADARLWDHSKKQAESNPHDTEKHSDCDDGEDSSHSTGLDRTIKADPATRCSDTRTTGKDDMDDLASSKLHMDGKKSVEPAGENALEPWFVGRHDPLEISSTKAADDDLSGFTLVDEKVLLFPPTIGDSHIGVLGIKNNGASQMGELLDDSADIHANAESASPGLVKADSRLPARGPSGLRGSISTLRAKVSRRFKSVTGSRLRINEVRETEITKTLMRRGSIAQSARILQQTPTTPTESAAFDRRRFEDVTEALEKVPEFDYDWYEGMERELGRLMLRS